MNRTKEEVIASLQEFVQQANGHYTKREYQRLGFTPSHPTILKLFGSWENALKAVGYSQVSTTMYSNEEIIEAVQQSIKENDGIPSRSKYVRSNIKPSITTVEERFGTWSKAVEAAGYQPNAFVQYSCSDEDMLEALRRFYIQNGFKIGYEMYESSGISPSASIIRKRYRTWNLALIAAGIPINQKKEPHYIDSELINAMKSIADGIPCPLSKNMYQFHAKETYPSVISIIRRFGSWSKALEEAGLPQVKNTYSDEEALQLIRSFIDYVGEFEASLDLYRRMGWLPGSTTITRRFGSWENALKRIGHQLKFKHYSKEIAIEQIRKAAMNNNGVISSAIYIKEGYKPSMNWIKSNFGSWGNAKKEANVK